MKWLARYLPLVLFVLLTVGGGTLIGTANVPGAWYAQLQKPPFNPPDWIFAPVWTVLYVFIAVAGWRIWIGPRIRWAMTLWWLQLGLNFLWSPVFFTLHMIGGALIVILLLLATIIAFIATTWERDRISAVLFLPYAAWVGFATLLNASILMLN